MSATATRLERRTQAATGVTAGYIRLTREESIVTGLSVPAQRDGIHSYVQHHELPNPVEYMEERAVGADVPFEKRLAGRRLIADIKSGKVSHIVCRDLDRLSRDTGLWLEFVELCCEHGVTIHTFSGPLALKSPSDRFASTVRAAAAQLEKDQVADRVKRAKRELAKQGKHLGGPPPFGYTSRSRRAAELVAAGMPPDQTKARAETEMPHGLVVDQKEAAVVKLVFHLYVDRLRGCRWIANELNRLGHRRRSGRLWHPDKVRRIINDPVLAGMVPYDEERFEAGYGKRAPKFRQALHQGNHEPIIPLELWQRAQKIKARNKPTIEMPVVSRNTPLSGVLRCRCGAPMTTRAAGAGKKYFYYLCTKRKYHGRDAVGGCSADRINSERLHAAFWGRLTEMVCSDEVVEQVYQMTQRMLGRQRDVAEAGVLAADLAKVERDLSLWYTRHDEAAGDAEKEAAWRRIVQLTEKKKSLRQQFQEQESQAKPAKPLSRQQVKEYVRGIEKLVAEADDRGRALVLSLVDQHGLTVQMLDGERMEIAMTLLPPGAAGEPVKVEAVATIASGNKIDLWLQEQGRKGLACACGCGQRIEVQRRHYWRGVPKYHYACRAKGMQNKRASITGDGYINGAQLAKRLGIGASTLSRWVRSGKLPKPDRSISGMMLFERASTYVVRPRSTTPG